MKDWRTQNKIDNKWHKILIEKRSGNCALSVHGNVTPISKVNSEFYGTVGVFLQQRLCFCIKSKPTFSNVCSKFVEVLVILG